MFVTQGISNSSTDPSFITCARLVIGFAIDILVGQDAHSVLWAKYYGGRFAP